MNFFVILLLSTVGIACAATSSVNPQCSVCTSTLDWVRSNENVLSFMKTDDQVTDEVMSLLESDFASEDICGQLSMCETTNDDEANYLTVLKRGRGGKRPRIPHHGHGGHDCERHNNC